MVAEEHAERMVKLRRRILVCLVLLILVAGVGFLAYQRWSYETLLIPDNTNPEILVVVRRNKITGELNGGRSSHISCSSTARRRRPVKEDL